MDIQDSLRQVELRHADFLREAQGHQAIHRANLAPRPSVFTQFARVLAALKAVIAKRPVTPIYPANSAYPAAYTAKPVRHPAR